MSAVTILDGEVPELSTWTYNGVLRDEKGQAIPGSALSELKVTLYEKVSLGVINNVQDVNILNTGRGTVDESGNLQIVWLPADGPIVNAILPTERHCFRLSWKWSGGTKAANHTVEFVMRNLAKLP